MCERMARLGFEDANRLAMMAVEETGIGIVRDKVVKNEFATALCGTISRIFAQ